MKFASRIGAVLCALSALVGTAHAADVPVKGPYLKAPPPVFNWSGFYGGLHAGGTRLEGDFTPIPGVAGSASGSGFVGGALIGYNWQTSARWVFGIEIDGGWTSADAAVTLAGPGPVISDLRWNAHVRGRIGYTMDRALFFVAAGLAVAEVEQFAPVGPGTVSNTLTGYSIGFGLDYAFAPRWIGRIEYLYDDFGTETFDYAPFGGSVIVSGYSTHTVRAALMYRW